MTFQAVDWGLRPASQSVQSN